jgi:hypothetical protein
MRGFTEDECREGVQRVNSSDHSCAFEAGNWVLNQMSSGDISTADARITLLARTMEWLQWRADVGEC